MLSPSSAPASSPKVHPAEVLAAPEGAAEFPSGRRVVLGDGPADHLTVFNPDGVVELAVRFTADGPVLSFSCAALNLATKGEMRLDCGKLRVRSRTGIEMETGGDFWQWVEGRHVVVAGDEARVEAASVQVEARLGAARVQANDEVQLLGEMVLLNCDREQPLPGWVPVAVPAERTLPAESVSGSAGLAAELAREPPGHAP